MTIINPVARGNVASLGARLVCDGFDQWTAGFRRLTLRARSRFEQRAWREGQQDSTERLVLYQAAVQAVVEDVRDFFGGPARAKAVWHEVKDAFLRLVARRADIELAETFFSSVARRVFGTVGVDPEIEFLEPQVVSAEASTRQVTRRFERTGSVVSLVHSLLHAYRFSVPYEDLDRDASLAAAEVDAYVSAETVQAIEVARPVFFRNKGAYIVGRIRTAAGSVPMVIALLNEEHRTGITVDAVLLTEDDVSLVFSFTRSYFFVLADRPRELVAFLHSLMPRKPIAELFIAIGHNRRAKTELYRDLQRHLRSSGERFEIARGARGMVMIVFTMPSYDVIFKVFRDHFDYPKTTTRQDVMAKYQLVFGHDRAGRLVDAQEFEYLEFNRDRFSEPLLEELLTSASETVLVRGDSVVIKHLYSERRVTPLDLYLREGGKDEGAARQAVLDYGAAVRDLAATNIFPGDLLLKNFGVTRHGRVVFYDYDELCLVTDCTFRSLPTSDDANEELSAEPWFYVDERDVFPEEFLSFLGLTGDLRQLFLSAHGYLVQPAFWIDMQRELREGRVIDIFPYPPTRRLHEADRKLAER